MRAVTLGNAVAWRTKYCMPLSSKRGARNSSPAWLSSMSTSCMVGISRHNHSNARFTFNSCVFPTESPPLISRKNNFSCCLSRSSVSSRGSWNNQRFARRQYRGLSVKTHSENVEGMLEQANISDDQAIWRATGVPLVDELSSFSSLEAAGIRAGKYIIFAIISALIGKRLLKYVELRCGEYFDEGVNGKKLNIIRSILGAVARPAIKLLPTYCGVFIATVSSSFFQVALTKREFLRSHFESIASLYAPSIEYFISLATQLIQDLADIVIIVSIAWALINLKDRMIYYIINTKFEGNKRIGMGRILESTMSFLNFVVYFISGIAILDACGINLTPLIASLGGISVIIGLASQSILGNVASAIALYSSPPFQVGHYIKLLDAGSVVVEGEVLALLPMRTVLRTPEKSTLYIDNAQVLGFMIQNDTQKH